MNLSLYSSKSSEQGFDYQLLDSQISIYFFCYPIAIFPGDRGVVDRPTAKSQIKEKRREKKPYATADEEPFLTAAPVVEADDGFAVKGTNTNKKAQLVSEREKGRHDFSISRKLQKLENKIILYFNQTK